MTTINHARSLDRAEPAYLVEISLKNSGPVLYLSDRIITVGGVSYSDYLIDLKGLAAEIKRSSPMGVNPSIALTFKNNAYMSYGRLVEIGGTYPFEAAACAIKECYISDGGAASDAETIYKGILDEPRDIDLMQFKCGVSRVQFKTDKPW